MDESTQAWYWRNTDTNETRWAEEGDDDNAGEEAAPAVDEWRGVHIVRYEGDGFVFMHWALFVEDPRGENDAGFLCHIMGKRTEYEYLYRRIKKPTNSTKRFLSIHQVGYVDTNSLRNLKDFAKAKRIHNEDEHWGCQDWAWEILDELENEGILEHREDFEEATAELESLKGPE